MFYSGLVQAARHSVRLNYCDLYRAPQSDHKVPVNKLFAMDISYWSETQMLLHKTCSSPIASVRGIVFMILSSPINFTAAEPPKNHIYILFAQKEPFMATLRVSTMTGALLLLSHDVDLDLIHFHTAHRFHRLFYQTFQDNIAWHDVPFASTTRSSCHVLHTRSRSESYAASLRSSASDRDCTHSI